MKEITKEKIEQIMDEVVTEITATSYQDYLDATKDIPAECKNNFVAHDEVAIAIAQAQASRIMKEVLIKLLAE